MKHHFFFVVLISSFCNLYLSVKKDDYINNAMFKKNDNRKKKQPFGTKLPGSKSNLVYTLHTKHEKKAEDKRKNFLLMSNKKDKNISKK